MSRLVEPGVVDAILELIIQIFLEFLFEYALDRAVAGAVALLVRRTGRWLFSGIGGLAFGAAWGRHLSGHMHFPRLLWVSLVLAALAAGRAVWTDRTHTIANRTPSVFRLLSQPPWRWNRERLVGVLIMNLGLAAGIVGAFRRG